MHTTLPKHNVVLLGAGHTNAHVLRMWRMHSPPDAQLTCVSNYPLATYSGMLPGTLAGLYTEDRMQIDLVRLCRAVGAHLILGNVTGLDVAAGELWFADRPPLPFDVLSVGIGSVPSRVGLDAADDTLLAIKPMQSFLGRLDARLPALPTGQGGEGLRVAVVGSGVAGVEIAFAISQRVRHVLGDVPLQVQIVGAGHQLAIGLPENARRLVEQELESRKIGWTLGQRVCRVERGSYTLQDGTAHPADLVLWVTQARPPELLEQIGLPKDDAGFLLTDSTLRTTAAAPIFAVGDTGTMEGYDLPKAGVYAVRQGPILWQNILRTLQGRPLRHYRPQSEFLKLLSTGDGRAILSYRGRAAIGRWCWRLKDRIDGRFMDKYQDYTPMAMEPPTPPSAEQPMRCAGCGGKVAGSVLSAVLARLEIPASDHVLIGLDRPDDAAVIQPPAGRPLIVTADFFAAPLEDAYLSGRLAALNAASDVFATGGQPLSAVALVTLPEGRPRHQEQLLYELLAGAMHEFRQMGATLIGGHTIEGPQTVIGFTMLADAGQAPFRTKDALSAGERLVLTKPLGTGALLAAYMQARCRGVWYESLLESMLASNQRAAELAVLHGIPGLTDVTGFGLAGHLLEMLDASNLAAEVELDRLPLLPGAAATFAAGIESTLAPANRRAEVEMQVAEADRLRPEYAALFDPQTCGGLLLGVAESQLPTVLQALGTAGYSSAACIGRLVPRTEERPQRIRVLAG